MGSGQFSPELLVGRNMNSGLTQLAGLFWGILTNSVYSETLSQRGKSLPLGDDGKGGVTDLVVLVQVFLQPFIYFKEQETFNIFLFMKSLIEI